MRHLPRRRVLSLALVTAGLSLASALPAIAATPVDGSAPAPAAATVNAEVMVLHATQVAGAGSIDPQIGNLPQLKKPPFSAYNTYKLLDKKSLALVKGAPSNTTLANQRVLQVTFEDLLPDKRYKVAAAINQPGGPSFLKLLEVSASPNETFFVAGQSYQGGILVIGITVKP